MRDQVRRCGCSFKAWALPGAVGTALYELHAEKKDRKSDGQGKGNQGRRGKKPWCSGSCAIQPKASIGRRLILCMMRLASASVDGPVEQIERKPHQACDRSEERDYREEEADPSAELEIPGHLVQEQTCDQSHWPSESAPGS